MRSVRGVAATVVTALLLAGCAGGGEGSDPTREDVMRPTGTASPAVTPVAAPRDSRSLTGEGFALAAPSAFVRTDRRSANGEPMLVLERASGVPELPTRVAVLREPAPKAGVVEQSYTLEVAKRTVAKATDVTRSALAWPGSTETVLVQWTESVPAGESGTVQVRYWQLNAQVSAKLIIIVVGYAPAAEFDASGVADVVRSFRVG